MSRDPVRIAVVDDDEPVCRALTRVLSLAGYRVSSFGSAEAFLASVGVPEFACLLLDLRLPQMQGLDLLKRLRSTNRTLPVVLITSDQDLADSPEVRTAGSTCLVKPVEEKALFETIAQATRE
jgi:FixJ family two-component response regulator